MMNPAMQKDAKQSGTVLRALSPVIMSAMIAAKATSATAYPNTVPNS